MCVSQTPIFPENIHFQSNGPFSNRSFYELLHKSNVIGHASGWNPLYFYQKSGAILPSFQKDHSYGEYIFDWEWANFYRQNARPYYPKLIHAIPFTPVNAAKIWGNQKENFQLELIDASFKYYQETNALTGEHYLFTDQSLNRQLQDRDFVVMETTQYHWNNNYNSFSEYLDILSKNRRKMIKKERRKVQDTNLEIRWLMPEELNSTNMCNIYNLYLSTIDKKYSQAYLNQKFFTLLPSYMQESLLINAAYLDGQMIAMAIFFRSKNALYGRYWGIDDRFAKQYPLLHFELCYYQGMDYCIEHKIPLFEAGAQGEQKLWRGFEPVTITSAHHIKDPLMFEIIKRHIQHLNHQNRLTSKELMKYLPFARS